MDIKPLIRELLDVYHIRDRIFADRKRCDPSWGWGDSTRDTADLERYEEICNALKAYLDE